MKMANRENKLQKLIRNKRVSTDALGVIWGVTQQNAVQKLKKPALKLNLQELMLLAMKLDTDYISLVKIILHDTDWNEHIDYKNLPVFNSSWLD